MPSIAGLMALALVGRSLDVEPNTMTRGVGGVGWGACWQGVLLDGDGVITWNWKHIYAQMPLH